MSTTTETASQATPNESTEANPEANPTGAPVATLAAKAEHRSTLFASSYPLILLIALTILLGVTYLSLITGRYRSNWTSSSAFSVRTGSAWT